MNEKCCQYVSLICILCLLCTLFTGCSGDHTGSDKEIQWSIYDASEDAPFLPKNIFSEDMFISGITPSEKEEYCLKITEETDTGSFVLKGEYGKCYEVKIPAGVPKVYSARFGFDPRTKAVGEYYVDSILYTSSGAIKEVSFMYTCRRREEYLLIYTGSSEPISIAERSILTETDTKGPWYVPKAVGGIGSNGTLGNVNWTAEEVVNNLYEPVREKYPDYITRTVIGKDQSGQHDMYGYVYEPKGFEATLFLTGGMHASEEIGYFALAKTMQLIADASPEDTLLYTLRQKVRFVVVPIINVWGASLPHNDSAEFPHRFLRFNSSLVDLNRDFGDLSQQESKNVISFFEQYADETDILMDFHVAKDAGISLWYNFINYSENSVSNYKTVNHMYHRYLEQGFASEYTDLSMVPGSYAKGNQYLEGRIWNEYAVPTITVEYVDNENFPATYSSECMTVAVETYLNFIIQNALFFLQ